MSFTWRIASPKDRGDPLERGMRKWRMGRELIVSVSHIVHLCIPTTRMYLKAHESAQVSRTDGLSEFSTASAIKDGEMETPLDYGHSPSGRG